MPRAYGSYEQLLADDEIEAVYVGTPNAAHAQWAVAAARAGKHVLCEKPLGASRAEAETMFAAAREHGVWLMEAFMYRFHPRTLRLTEIVAAGEIGPPALVRASFGFAVTDPANVRLSAELAGGALMDVGCYPVNAARMIAGPVRAATATARWQDVDVTLAGVLDHTGGALSLVSCSLVSGRHNELEVVGSDGVITVPDAFTPPKDRPSTMLVTRGTDTEEQTFAPVDQYTLEAEGFAALVAAGHEAAADAAADAAGRVAGQRGHDRHAARDRPPARRRVLRVLDATWPVLTVRLVLASGGRTRPRVRASTPAASPAAAIPG